MARFLVIHMIHQRTELWVVTSEQRYLGIVDESGSKLASLVDSKLEAPSDSDLLHLRADLLHCREIRDLSFLRGP